MFAEIDSVVVLENAAHLNIWQGEGLGHVLYAAGLNDRFVESLATEVNNRSIGFDSARMKIYDAPFFLEKRNFDVGELATFLRKDLDSEVNVFMSGHAAVVTVYLAK